jgi:UDP-N-acetylmuramate dehydrogenase
MMPENQGTPRMASWQDELSAIFRPQEPLAPYTSLKLGGPAQWLAQPQSADQLAFVVKRCVAEQIPFRVLGGGSNLLVKDEGVGGMVIRLHEPAFTTIEVQGRRLRAAAGAPLTAVISQAAQHALAGLEALIGIPGTVGGALRSNAGSRSGTISQYVRQVAVLDRQGEPQVRERDDIDFSPQGSSLDDAMIVGAEFELETDDPESILKRMRKLWIHKKARQPLSFQAAGRLFHDPRGLSADQLIEQAGLAGTKVGGAEISECHANYVIAHPGATARDVLRLIDMVRSRVADQFGQTLQPAIVIW